MSEEFSSDNQNSSDKRSKETPVQGSTPQPEIKIVKDLIFWESAKVVASLVSPESGNDDLIAKNFMDLNTGQLAWKDIFEREINKIDRVCLYCGNMDKLYYQPIIPNRLCREAELYNMFYVCGECKKTKTYKDIFSLWGKTNKHEVLKIAMVRYLKMLYLCHECKESLNHELAGKNKLSDLDYVFNQQCRAREIKARAFKKIFGFGHRSMRFTINMYSIIILVITFIGIVYWLATQVERAEKAFQERMNSVQIGMSKERLYEVFGARRQEDYTQQDNKETITFSDWLEVESGNTVTFYLKDGKVTGWQQHKSAVNE